MRVIRHEWQDVARGDQFRIYPIADVHAGASACDEKRFKAVVQQIADDEHGYWIDLGDKCEYVNRSDRRFDPATLAPWLQVQHLGDIAKAQRDWYLDHIKPIAGKCIATVEGNHEYAVKARYERDVHYEVTSAIKAWGGMEADAPLSVGVTGWLLLVFYRSETKRTQHTIRVNLHHGFVGGRLMGAKALNLQRWLWSHDCDLCLMGHCHVIELQKEAVERVRGRTIHRDTRIGAFCGSFLNGGSREDTYIERKGYFPTAPGQVVVHLRPGARLPADRVRMMVS